MRLGAWCARSILALPARRISCTKVKQFFADSTIYPYRLPVMRDCNVQIQGINHLAPEVRVIGLRVYGYLKFAQGL